MKITRSQIKKLIKESIAEQSPKRYWGIAGSGIVFICAEDKTIFLQQRSKKISSGAGKWAQPGGGIFPQNEEEKYHYLPIPQEEVLEDNDPRFYQTAVKEVTEECGSCPPHKVLDSYVFNDHGFKYKTFIANMKKADKDRWIPEAQPEHAWESEDMRWFSMSQFLKLDLFIGFVPELISKIIRLVS